VAGEGLYIIRIDCPQGEHTELFKKIHLPFAVIFVVAGGIMGHRKFSHRATIAIERKKKNARAT